MIKRKSRTLFNSIRGQSLSSRIVNQVIDALFARKLRPGEFLGTEAQLAAEFQTSRVPIREALGRLEALGAVKIKSGSGGGATIAEGEPDQFAIALAVQFMLVGATAGELLDARIAVECRGAELAAQEATEEELTEIRGLFEEIIKGETGRAAMERILQFHVAIVEASHSRTLIALMHAIEHALLHVYMEAWQHQAGHAPQGYVRLNKIVAALTERDPQTAHDVMRDHLLLQREIVVSRLAQQGGEPH